MNLFKVIILDTLERFLRAFIFFIIFIFYLRELSIANHSISSMVTSIKHEFILVIIIIWIFSAVYLSVSLSPTRKISYEWIVNFLKTKVNLNISSRNAIYAFSSALQYICTIFFGCILGEYQILLVIFSVTLLYFLLFIYFEKISLFFYKLGASQSQLSFFLAVVAILLPLAHYYKLELTFNTLVLLYALRFSLLHFVKFISISAILLSKYRELA